MHVERHLAGVIGIVAAFVVICVLFFVPFGIYGLNGMTLERLVLFVVCLLPLGILGGWRQLRPSTKGFVPVLICSLPALAYDAYISLSSLEARQLSAAQPVENWQLVVLEVIILCIVVGLFEETLFRGLLFGGLLAEFGSTKSGIVASVLISSFLFGIVHVIGDIPTSIGKPLEMAQVVLKTLQAGALGFTFAVLYLRSHSILAISGAHFLNDAILMVAIYPFGGQVGSYVQYTLVEGIASIVGLLIVIGFYIPMVIHAAKLLRWEVAPCYGPLVERWEARDFEAEPLEL